MPALWGSVREEVGSSSSSFLVAKNFGWGFSDLLSRHVNKCHASEKLLPNAGNARRKGAVSATRATTSKQSCDQCVLATLPCDGSNPCCELIKQNYSSVSDPLLK